MTENFYSAEVRMSRRDEALHFHLELENDVVYILECLAQDYTGEAKRCLRELNDMLSQSPMLSLQERERLLGLVTEVRSLLSASSSNPDARRQIADLRRSIHNTSAVLRGSNALYPYAKPLDIVGTALLDPAPSFDLQSCYPHLRTPYETHTTIVLLGAAEAVLAKQTETLARALVNAQLEHNFELESDESLVSLLELGDVLAHSTASGAKIEYRLPDHHFLRDEQWNWHFDHLVDKLAFVPQGYGCRLLFGCLNADGLHRLATAILQNLPQLEADPNYRGYADPLRQLARVLHSHSRTMQGSAESKLAWVSAVLSEVW